MTDHSIIEERGVGGRQTEGELRPGDALGELVVVRVLGRGGTAAVYEVRDRFGRRLAAKVFHPEYGAPANEALERFRRAAQLFARVRSIHVPRAHGMGIGPDGAPFILMDFVAGVSLDRFLAYRLPRLGEAIEIARQLLAGLAAVHRAGAIHRDVKPSNVILSEGGIVRIVDFGICKPLLESGPEITQHDVVLGTPSYMSPEQIVNARLDVRADLWAVGALLYEMITGERPFRAASPAEVLTAVLRDPVLPPSLMRPDCPRDLERVVMQAMQRDRAVRYATATAMRDALGRVTRQHGFPVGVSGQVDRDGCRRAAGDAFDDRPTRPARI